jgi:patatin-like phospholipase/acyl hydrolase
MIFRSYYAEEGPPSKYAIWQAAWAATAAPSFFKPMLIDTLHPAILYIDGELGYNTPHISRLQKLSEFGVYEINFVSWVSAQADNQPQV